MYNPAKTDNAGAPERRVKVLLAEDDDDIRSVFEMVLGDAYELRSAGTAAQALALAVAWTPDVVLLDWTLPDASGDDVVRQLRLLKSESLPIVVVSGAPTVKALAAAVGAIPCPKPCDIDQLTSAIELALTPTRGR
jgi:DNA-binding response OmpR family regulator